MASLLSFFRIIKIVDTVGLKLTLGKQPETLVSSALALSVAPTDGTNFQEMFFSISDPNTVQVSALELSPVLLFILNHSSFGAYNNEVRKSALFLFTMFPKALI